MHRKKNKGEQVFFLSSDSFICFSTSDIFSSATRSTGIIRSRRLVTLSYKFLESFFSCHLITEKVKKNITYVEHSKKLPILGRESRNIVQEHDQKNMFGQKVRNRSNTVKKPIYGRESQKTVEHGQRNFLVKNLKFSSSTVKKCPFLVEKSKHMSSTVKTQVNYTLNFSIFSIFFVIRTEFFGFYYFKKRSIVLLSFG